MAIAGCQTERVNNTDKLLTAAHILQIGLVDFHRTPRRQSGIGIGIGDISEHRQKETIVTYQF